ncbi:MAG TPA: secondary thiamine-phosphate synthase enzyme YjbQ [Candidatus Krumholzibacteria bacterium]|nr:secondary thiamine-phosphate synthase enzyme YjbQ [Candidatus Krumholzibacteria bacterium]
MRQELTEFTLSTQGKQMLDFSDEVRAWVKSTGIEQGLLTLQIRHTSASLLVQENYDPTVQSDFERFLARLVPDGDPIFRHTAEGPDDMPAHVRSALTSTTLSLPVADGAPTLGTWQGIYLCEHRSQGHTRRVSAHLLGE